MDHEEVGRFWNTNADAWTALARAGYDVDRDYLNTPAFCAMLPDVTGLSGLDIGCGEGHNTRLLAKRGARVTALDIAEVFIAHAQQAEEGEPLGIDYRVASAVALPFAEGTFDFATGVMSFMDIPETERVLAEAYRVLRPGGFLQFSIAHPCFDTPHRGRSCYCVLRMRCCALNADCRLGGLLLVSPIATSRIHNRPLCLPILSLAFRA
jgi:ubiquinone/menaquinone biosynthesis C-methylase UbiE